MRLVAVTAVLSMGAMVLGGCGGGAPECGAEFTSNAPARQFLSNTSWEDRSKEFEIGFDANARMNKYAPANPPEEFEDFNLDCEQFDFTIPQNIPTYGGTAITLQLGAKTTRLDDNHDGTYPLTTEFTGHVTGGPLSGVIEYATVKITATGLGDPGSGPTELTNLKGTLTLYFSVGILKYHHDVDMGIDDDVRLVKQ